LPTVSETHETPIELIETTGLFDVDGKTRGGRMWVVDFARKDAAHMDDKNLRFEFLQPQAQGNLSWIADSDEDYMERVARLDARSARLEIVAK
jgi:hypothetical protein